MRLPTGDLSTSASDHAATTHIANRLRAIAHEIFALMLPAWILLAVALVALPAAATTVVVSSTGDDADGDTSSIANLIANPGQDGTISLREALMAANNTAGSDAITISFAPALAGQTIFPAGLEITRDGIALAGLVDQNGQPTVTIDASQLAGQVLLFVEASNISVTSLRFVRIQASASGKFMIQLRAGDYFGFFNKPHVNNIAIRGNVFSNDAGSTNSAIAISLGMESSANGAIFSDVAITGNTFSHFRGDSNGLLIGPSGTNNTIQNVVVASNNFTDIEFSVEFGCGGTGNRILGSRVIGNSFTNNLLPVGFVHSGTNGSPATSGNLINDTIISRNVFTANRGPDIGIGGGLSNATSNTTTNTTIVNNLATGETQFGAVSVVGGRDGATQNSISGVLIVNNTITANARTGNSIDVNPNIASSGNTISGVAVANTVLWNNAGADFFGVTPSQVQYSITTQANFFGVNNNINADPLFANSGAGNFHLQSGSPALHAGTSSGAPTIDLDCQPRGSPPSIGAYEFNGPNICPTNVAGQLTSAHDFNGDRISDILFQNTGGGIAMWLMNSNATVQSALGVGSTTNVWSIIGQRDINGDGQADLLFRANDGSIAEWLMNGATIMSANGLGNPTTAWNIVGTGDFNGDGIGDVLFRGGGTAVAIWYMNSAGGLGSAVGVGSLPNDWTVAGTGDFDGDGVWDILWYNNLSGGVATWLMNPNGTVKSAVAVGSLPAGWSLAGTGDFNGDSISDILLSAGLGGGSTTAAIWFMNSSGGIASAQGVGTMPSGWAVAQTGDFNGDGKSDILWYNSTSGGIHTWLLNGATVTGAVSIGSLPPSSWMLLTANSE